MKWLMLQSEISRIEGLLSAKVSQADLDSVAPRAEVSAPNVLRGGLAVIPVKGPLVDSPSGILDFFGVEYTVYGDIESQVKATAKTPNVRHMRFDIDSPGGIVSDALYSLMDAIANSPVPTSTRTSGYLASAAYMVASQTGKITAKNDLTMVGSIGVVTAAPEGGELVNTDSPNKRHDPTEEGIEARRAELDDVYDVLAAKMATGRGVSEKTIRQDYGQGSLMTAKAAKDKRIIDAIERPKTLPAEKPAAKGEIRMDINALKAEHPDLYREVFEAGVADERGRTGAHLTLAKASGDYETAYSAIEDGSRVTEACTAKHVAAGIEAAIKARSIELRADETTPPLVPGVAPLEGGGKIKAEMETQYPEIEVEI